MPRFAKVLRRSKTLFEMPMALRFACLANDRAFSGGRQAPGCKALAATAVGSIGWWFSAGQIARDECPDPRANNCHPGRCGNIPEEHGKPHAGKSWIHSLKGTARARGISLQPHSHVGQHNASHRPQESAVNQSSVHQFALPFTIGRAARVQHLDDTPTSLRRDRPLVEAGNLV
jgi:hypothetical protein